MGTVSGFRTSRTGPQGNPWSGDDRNKSTLQVSRSAPNGWAWPSVVDLNVAQQPPRADLDLGTLAGFHVDTLIPEERGSAGGHPGARGNVQLDISDQVEDAKDGCLTRRPGAQVQPHVTNEEHDLLISPSDGQGAFSHIPGQRTPLVWPKDPLAERERLTQSQAATAPRTTAARATHSTGLGEKLTSAYTHGVSGGEPTNVNASNGFLLAAPGLGAARLCTSAIRSASP
jgi:hypothetical protein